MGGDNTADAANGRTPDTATQAVIDQLNARLTQDAGQPPTQAPTDTRAGYGVAPAAANNIGAPDPHADPFFHGKVKGGRAGYGVSGTDAPGGAGIATNKPGGEVVPNFIQAHQNDVRDPSQPYTPNPIGAQAQQQAQGRPGAPGAGAPADTNESRIRQAISTRGQYLSMWTPAFGGLGAITAPVTAKGLSWGADALVAHAPETSGIKGIPNKLAHYWQDNYDVTKVGKTDLIKAPIQSVAADTEFARLKEAVSAATRTGDEAAQALAKERLSYLDRTLTPSTVVDIKAASAARVEAGGPALFSDSELATIEGKYTAGAARDITAEKAMIAGLQDTGPTLFKSFKAGTIGILADIGAVNVDRFAAKSIGGENSLLHSWNTEQILAPIALAAGESLVGKSLWGKAALLGGTIIASRLIDGGSQAIGLGAPEKWNAVTGVMNGWDGFGVATGIAIAAAAKNPWAKVAAVGAGWAIPKLIHLAEDSGDNALAYQYENLTEKITADHSKRSYSSLESATNAAETLDNKKEDWLVGKIATNRNTLTAQWKNMSPDQQLLSFRDDAGMSAALGEDLLKKGTRIAKQGAPDYTLGGYEMDLGGRAMHYLISAKDSTERAAAMTQGIIDNNNDSSKQPILVNGDKPSKSEVDGLNKFEGNIKTDLAKIMVQKHDIQGVVNQVVKNIPSSSDDWRQTYIRPTDSLIEHYVPRNTPAQAAETKQVIGKLYRDQAIAYLAFAEDKMDRGKDGQGALDMLMNNSTTHDIFPSGRQKGYNGAQGTILMSMKFDPNNADLPEIQQIWAAEVKKAQALAGVQLTDPNINILNYGGQAPRPAGQ